MKTFKGGKRVRRPATPSLENQVRDNAKFKQALKRAGGVLPLMQSLKAHVAFPKK